MTLWLSVLLFGAAGVAARFGIDRVVGVRLGEFPAATFAVNFVGCLLAGFFAVLGREKGLMSEALTVGLLAGFCGGFTTLSGYALQVLNVAARGEGVGLALAYAVVSPAFGLAAAFGGAFFARRFIN